MRNALQWPVSLVALVLFTLVAGGCAHPGSIAQRSERTSQLARQLAALDSVIDPAEARQLAAAAVEQSAALSAEYRPAQPAWMNNIFVNAGLRERGLCYHWANELFRRLYPLDLRTMELHLGVAGRDTPHEHNSVIITARGQPFGEGLVLDAWRYGGRLFFVPVADDPRYPWQPLPITAMQPDIRDLVREAPAAPRQAPQSR